MPINFVQPRTGINFTMTVPQNITLSAPQKAVAPAAPKPVEPRQQVSAGENNCFSHLIEMIKDFFSSFTLWFSQLFASSDPALLAKWDPIVEKEYDPIGCTRPQYGDIRRGKSLADAFVRAASKTGINPSFKHVLVIDRFRDGGSLFSDEGHYCYLRPRAQELNNRDTLVVVGIRVPEVLKNGWEKPTAERICNATCPMHNAVIAPLNGRETDLLEGGRMPASLLKLLKERSPVA